MHITDFFLTKKTKFALSLILTLTFMVLLYFTGGIWFDTNDDVFIEELLSGKITGTPEWRCRYVSALITWPITGLYKVLPNVPWWGILIFSVLFLSVFISLYCTVLLSDTLFKMCLFMASSFTVIIAGIHSFGQAQFTCAAILLAFAGYIVLIGGPKNKASLIGFFLCELLACAIRDSSMILVQPAGLMFYAGMLLRECTSKEKFMEIVKRVSVSVIALIGVLALSKGLNVLTFSDAAWKEYYKYNDIQSYVVDYEPKVSYESVSDILEKYDISKDEYDQTFEYRTWYLNNKFTGPVLDELLPALSKIRGTATSPAKFIEGFKQLLFTSSEFWHLHQFTAAFFLLCAVAALIAGCYTMLIPTAMTFVGYAVGIAFLAYRDRYVLRVFMPYYLGTILLLCFILMHIFTALHWNTVKEKVRVLATAVLVASVFIFGLSIGRVQFAYLRAQNHVVNTIFFSEQKEINDYCVNHPDKHYVLDMSCARFVSTDIFEHDYYLKANHIYSGSWYSNTPVFLNFGREYISDGCYYLVYEAQEFRGVEGMEYYSRCFNTEPVLDDKFKLSSGATIWVYKIAGQ